MSTQYSPDPATKQVIDMMEASPLPKMHELSPAEAREQMLQTFKVLDIDPPDVGRTEDRTIPGPGGDLPVRIYWPKGKENEKGLPILVYFHGGGFVVGSIETHDSVCRYLSNGAECVVMSVDYRMGPEWPFPAAPDDAFAATRWAAEHATELGADPTRLAVGGDSAGGNLSAVVCHRAIEERGPNISFQLLIYPAVDEMGGDPGFTKFKDAYVIDHLSVGWFMGHYLPEGHDPKDKNLAPLHIEEFKDLPPAFVLTAGLDPLREEGEAYAKKLEAAGVPVTYRCYETTIHGFINMAKAIPVGLEALKDMSAALKAGLSKQAKAAE